MNKNKWIVIAIILILIVVVVYVSWDRQLVSDGILPADILSDDILDEKRDPWTPSIRVESLTVNGQAGPQITLGLDEELVITAVLVNEDQEKEAEITMSVGMGGELFDGRHAWTYVLEPDETREIEEVRETHHTWYEDGFTVEIGDRLIEVVVTD